MPSLFMCGCVRCPEPCARQDNDDADVSQEVSACAGQAPHRVRTLSTPLLINTRGCLKGVTIGAPLQLLTLATLLPLFDCCHRTFPCCVPGHTSGTSQSAFPFPPSSLAPFCRRTFVSASAENMKKFKLPKGTLAQPPVSPRSNPRNPMCPPTAPHALPVLYCTQCPGVVPSIPLLMFVHLVRLEKVVYKACECLFLRTY